MTSYKGQRVLMLIENQTYPLDHRVRQEAVTLSKAGYAVQVICPSAPGQRRYEVIDDVRVYRYPAPPDGSGLGGYLWEYGYSLVAALAVSLRVYIHPGFDVLHAANPPDTAVLVAAIFKLLGKRFVYDQHDLVPELYRVRFDGSGSPFIYRLLVWLERISCRMADHVIATNQSYKALQMQRGSVPEERITVVRNGPDLDRLRPGESKAGLHQEGKTLIVYVGIIGQQDGVDCLVRAVHHLICDLKRRDFHCLVVGAGGALQETEALAQQLQLQDHMSFTGWVEPEDVAGYICAGDIGVAPEPSNPLNDRSTMVKIMEYMTLSKPIVAFDLPEHRVTAGEAAIYARPNDELDFARQLAILMDDPERRKKMGQIGRKRIENDLAWHHQAQCLLDAYASISVRHKAVHVHPGN